MAKIEVKFDVKILKKKDTATTLLWFFSLGAILIPHSVLAITHDEMQVVGLT